MQPSQHEKAETFRELHQQGVFLIPNPWDAGSARVLAALGFPALASTSSGFAFTLGRPDGAATDVVDALSALLGAIDLARDDLEASDVDSAVRGDQLAGRLG